MAISIQTTLVFITLIYLVVIELSAKTGTRMLLERLEMEGSPVLGIFPNLGMFTYVHVLNSFLLMTGYLVISTNFLGNDNIAITLVLLLTAAMLLLLPYLEVEEYDIISRNSASLLDSKRTHFLFSIVVFVEPLIFIATNALKGEAGLQIVNVIGTLIFIAAFFLPLAWFLIQIGEEAERYWRSNEVQTDLDQFAG